MERRRITDVNDNDHFFNAQDPLQIILSNLNWQDLVRLRATSGGFRNAVDAMNMSAFLAVNGMEPRKFYFKVAPGQSVHAAVRNCPVNGSVLLLPGRHVIDRPLVIDKNIFLFGRSAATLAWGGQYRDVAVVSVTASPTLDGINIENEAGIPGINVRQGAPTFRECGIYCPRNVGINVRTSATVLGCILDSCNQGIITRGPTVIDGCVVVECREGAVFNDVNVTLENTRFVRCEHAVYPDEFPVSPTNTIV